MIAPLRTVSEPPVGEPLWLASGSPRRRRMLDELKLSFEIRPAGIDDGRLDPGGTSPAAWVAALAYLKARWVADRVGSGGVVIGADTVCVHDSAIFGQPRDAAEAARMLRTMRESRHETMTGVCVIDPDAGTRWFLVDRTIVSWGEVPDAEIDAYVLSKGWCGKAGGYNLQERVEAGWPVTTEGDPETVMGLPLERLRPWFDNLRRYSCLPR